MNARIVRGSAVAALVLAGITISTPAFAADEAQLSVARRADAAGHKHGLR